MQVRHAGREVIAPAAYTLTAARSSPCRAATERKPTNHTRRGHLFELGPNFSGVIASLLRRSVLSLHAEEVARAWKNLMEDPHDACEHLGCDALVDLRIVFEGQSGARTKYVVGEAYDFILVISALEIAVPRVVV